MSIGANERLALKGEILEYTRAILDCTPPLNGKLPDLGTSLWHARSEPALAINDADKPVRRNVPCAEEAQETLLSHGHCQSTKRLSVLEDRSRDVCDPILRDGTYHHIGYNN